MKSMKSISCFNYLKAKEEIFQSYFQQNVAVQINSFCKLKKLALKIIDSSQENLPLITEKVMDVLFDPFYTTNLPDELDRTK